MRANDLYQIELFVLDNNVATVGKEMSSSLFKNNVAYTVFLYKSYVCVCVCVCVNSIWQ